MTEATSQASRANAAGIVKRSSSYFADPTKITRRQGWNPRIDFGEDLSDSIIQNGVLTPLRVKRVGEGFELVDGDRRLTGIEAAIKKGHSFPEGVPIIIVDKGISDADALVQMIVANEGKAFLPMEEAVAYKKLQDEGMTLDDICKRVGRAHMHVSQILALLVADPALQEAAANGSISKQNAKDIAQHGKGDPEAQKKLVELAKAATNKKARKVLKVALDDARRAKAAKKGKVLKARALSDGELSDLGKQMADSLKAKLSAVKPEFSSIKDVEAWVGNDAKLQAAYTYGALMALKAAAGMKIALIYE